MRLGVLACVLFVATVGFASAASRSPVTCSVSPDPVAAGGAYAASFSGLPADRDIGILINGPDGFYWPINLNNSNGGSSLLLRSSEGQLPVLTTAGGYTIRVEERVHRKVQLLGSCAFSVT